MLLKRVSRKLVSKFGITLAMAIQTTKIKQTRVPCERSSRFDVKKRWNFKTKTLRYIEETILFPRQIWFLLRAIKRETFTGVEFIFIRSAVRRLFYMCVKFQINLFIGSQDIVPTSWKNFASWKTDLKFDVQCENVYSFRTKFYNIVNFSNFVIMLSE